MDSFLVLGHGIESPIEFEERNIIPDGYTLVTIAECGIVTTIDEVCPMIRAFTNADNQEIFGKPRANKAMIREFLNGKDIHIFEAGDRYPNLLLQMFLDWNKNNYVEIFKSGLYKFPIQKEGFGIGKGRTYCEKLFKTIGPYKGFLSIMPEDFNANEMFEDSIYPTAEEVNRLIETHKRRSDKVKKGVTIPLETLFEKGGPGVYYYVVCRHPKDIVSPNTLVQETLQLSNNTQFKPYYNKNWISKLNTLIPMLEEYQATRKPGYWNYEEIGRTIRNYKQLQRVPGIRRKSILQQEGKGLTRKKQVKKRKTRRFRLRRKE
jgi:hypothetical protein